MPHPLSILPEHRIYPDAGRRRLMESCQLKNWSVMKLKKPCTCSVVTSPKPPALHLSQATLYRKLRDYGMTLEDSRIKFLLTGQQRPVEMVSPSPTVNRGLGTSLVGMIDRCRLPNVPMPSSAILGSSIFIASSSVSAVQSH